MMAFYPAPGPTVANNLPRNYLVFLALTDAEASSQALKIGQSIKIGWSDPSAQKTDGQDDELSPKWNGQILPPFSGFKPMAI